MRKLLAYSFCIGMSFVGVHSSYAQYPDAESLLGRLGVKIDKDEKPVADGFPPALLDTWCKLDSYLAKDGFWKKEILLGKKYWTGPGLIWPQKGEKGEMVLKEGQWDDFVACRFDSLPGGFTGELKVCVDRLKMAEVVPFFVSGEFLKGVFGEDLFRALFEKARDKEEKIYTSLFHEIELLTYCSLAEKYGKRGKASYFLQEEEAEKDFQDAQKHYESCLNELDGLYKQIQSVRKECKKYMGKEKRWNPLWDALAECNVSNYYSMDRDRFRRAGDVFFKELGVIFGSKARQHPLWGYFMRLCELSDKFEKLKVDLNDARQVRDRCEERRGCMRQQRVLEEMFAEYRERFADAECRCPCYRKYYDGGNYDGGYPVSKEPVTFVLRITQEHYEDNGARRFRTEEWTQRLTDLNIELCLTIDLSTKELLEASCKGEFVVDGKVITNFGNGLCIFKSKQTQGFVKEKK